MRYLAPSCPQEHLRRMAPGSFDHLPPDRVAGLASTSSAQAAGARAFAAPSSASSHSSLRSRDSKKVLKRAPSKAVCATCGQEGPEDQLKSRRHLETKIHVACEWWSQGVELMFREPAQALNRFHEATKALKKTHIKWRRGITDAILLAREITVLSTRPIHSSGSKFREPSMTSTDEMEQWLQHLSSCGNVYARHCIAMWDHVKKYRITDTTIANWRAKAESAHIGHDGRRSPSELRAPAIIIDEETMEDAHQRCANRFGGPSDQQRKSSPSQGFIAAHTTPPILREAGLPPASLFGSEVVKKDKQQSRLDSVRTQMRQAQPSSIRQQRSLAKPSQEALSVSVPAGNTEDSLQLGSHQQLMAGVPFEMETENSEKSGLLLNHLQNDRPPSLVIPTNGNPMEPMLLPAQNDANTQASPLALSLSKNKIACPRCGTRVRFLRYNNGKLCIDKASLVKHLLNSCARVGQIDGDTTLGKLIKVLKSVKVVRKKQRNGKPGDEQCNEGDLQLNKPMPLSMRDVQNADITRLRQSAEWYDGAEKDLIMLRREVDVIASVIQSSHYYLKQNGLLQNHVPPMKESPKGSMEGKSPSPFNELGHLEPIAGAVQESGTRPSLISQYSKQESHCLSPHFSQNFPGNSGYFRERLSEKMNAREDVARYHPKDSKWDETKRTTVKGSMIAENAFSSMPSMHTSMHSNLGRGSRRPQDSRRQDIRLYEEWESQMYAWPKSNLQSYRAAETDPGRQGMNIDTHSPPSSLEYKNNIHSSNAGPLDRPERAIGGSDCRGENQPSLPAVGGKRKRVPPTDLELELQAKVDALQARNKKLEARIAALMKGRDTNGKKRDKPSGKNKSGEKKAAVWERDRKAQVTSKNEGHSRKKQVKRSTAKSNGRPAKVSKTSKSTESTASAISASSKGFASGDGNLEGMAVHALAALCAHDQQSSRGRAVERKKKGGRRRTSKSSIF